MKKTLALIMLLTIPGLHLVAQNKKSSGGEKEKMVEITTDYGTMKIKLYNETPKHRDNFIKLASEGFYNGLLFHRVISLLFVPSNHTSIAVRNVADFRE